MQTIVCENCGKPFEATQRQVTRGKKACSKECRYALVSQKHSKEPVTINCERCGKPFEVIPSHAKLRKHCSQECKSPPVFGVCQNCGVTFRYSPSSHSMFCSRQCAESSSHLSEVRSLNTSQAWQDNEKRQHIMTGIEKRSNSPEWRSAPHFQPGANHPRFKGNKGARINNYEYKSWIKAVKTRDNSTCQMCGSRKYLQAHHIKAWAGYPELRYEVSNGITICEECHFKVHGKKFTPRTRICAHCGQSFRPAKSLTKYCCRNCYKLSRQLNNN